MKFTDMPEDIKKKSLNDLKEEISKAIEELEHEKDLNNSIEKYNKLIQLNKYVENTFKEKAKEISKKTSNFISKISKKKNNNEN